MFLSEVYSKQGWTATTTTHKLLEEKEEDDE